MIEPLYAWVAHPAMPPRSEAYFVGYWSTMPRSMPADVAKRRFLHLLRTGHLVTHNPAPAQPDLFGGLVSR